MFNHNAYNLLLFYRKIEIWVELMNGYDKSKVDFLVIFNANHLAIFKKKIGNVRWLDGKLG